MGKGKKPAQKRLPLNKSQPSLIKELGKDIAATYWLITVLAVIAVATAMFQAKTSHEARRAVAESQKLREKRQQQEIELQSLRLELTSLTEANRISSLAKKNLDMIEISTKNEKIITL